MLESLRTRVAQWLVPKELSEQQLATIFGLQQFQNAPTAGVQELLRLYNESPWLRAVVSKIAYRFAANKWELFVRVGANGIGVRDADLQHAPMDYRHKEMRRMKQLGELKKIDDHLLLDLLASANPMMTGLMARKLTQTYMDLVGESFWALGLNAFGAPTSFWPIPPHWVTETPTTERPFFDITVQGHIGQIAADCIVWFRDPDPLHPYSRGKGTGLALGDEIELDEYATKFMKTFFYNRAKPEMIIGIKGASQIEVDQAKEVYENKHRGFQRSHLTMWTGAEISVKELQQKFTDMEMTELRKAERDVIIQVFGVPPEELGITENSNRATAREAEVLMAKGVLIPRLEDFRDTIQADVVPLFDERLIVDFISPVPDDREFKLKVMIANDAAFTRGEWRDFGDELDRGSGDDVHLVPLNVIEEPAPTPDTPSVARARELVGVEARLLPAHVKAVDQQGVLIIVDALEADTLTQELQPLWSDEFQKWGERATADLGLDPSAFEMLNPFVVNHLEEFSSTRITMVNNTTKEAVRKVLAEGVAAGEGADDLARRIRGVMSDASRRRSITIARTETVRSSNAANESAFIQSGIVAQKEWLVTPDGERHDEAGYGGTRALVGTDFEFIDGAMAPYPGGFGEPGQDINCRCAIAPIIEGERALSNPGAIWKVLESKRRPWERAARAAFRRGFAAQLQDALDALAEVDQ